MKVWKDNDFFVVYLATLSQIILFWQIKCQYWHYNFRYLIGVSFSWHKYLSKPMSLLPTYEKTGKYRCQTSVFEFDWLFLGPKIAENCKIAS